MHIGGPAGVEQGGQPRCGGPACMAGGQVCVRGNRSCMHGGWAGRGGRQCKASSPKAGRLGEERRVAHQDGSRPQGSVGSRVEGRGGARVKVRARVKYRVKDHGDLHPLPA